jgi:hypothetical protein
MANIFRVYKDSQVTTDRIRAEAAADSIVIPERVVYVFGTADDVAPNFTTVAGAITYANSLTPIVTEPVVIRLFTKIDGTPYDLTGIDTWAEYANQWIYILSDFVRLNVETAEIPTILPAGQQVWYIDPNGVETLWVGREDGSAWPAVGYKEFTAGISGTTVTVIKNDLSVTPTATVTGSETTLSFSTDQWAVGNVRLLPYTSQGSQLRIVSLGGTQYSFAIANLDGNPTINKRTVRLSTISVNATTGAMSQVNFVGILTIIVAFP